MSDHTNQFADPWTPVAHADAPAPAPKPGKASAGKPSSAAAPTTVPLTLQMTIPPEIAETLAVIADGQAEMVAHLVDLVAAQTALGAQIKRLIATSSTPTPAPAPDAPGSDVMET